MHSEINLLKLLKTQSSQLIRRLDWDSKFFLMEVGEVEFRDSEKINIQMIFQEAREHKLDLIYLRSLIELAHVEESFELQLVDKKITYTIDISKINTKTTHSNIFISPKKERPSKDLIDLGILAGHYSRFKLDKKIEEKKFNELYTLWITNSIKRKFADQVFEYRDTNNIVGVVTVKIKNDYAEIGLISVNKNIQGKGVGSLLVEAVINWLKLKTDITQLNVVTQIENINACRFYEKMGFIEMKREFIYHLRTYNSVSK